MSVEELIQATKLLVKISSTKTLKNLTDEELHLLVKIIRVNPMQRKRKRKIRWGLIVDHRVSFEDIENDLLFDEQFPNDQ